MAMWRFRGVTINIDNLGGDVNMAESPKWYNEAHGQNRTRGNPHQVNNGGDSVHERRAGDDATPRGPDYPNAMLAVPRKILRMRKGNRAMQIKHDHHKAGSYQRFGPRGGGK